jgi:hypothetical protein
MRFSESIALIQRTAPRAKSAESEPRMPDSTKVNQMPRLAGETCFSLNNDIERIYREHGASFDGVTNAARGSIGVVLGEALMNFYELGREAAALGEPPAAPAPSPNFKLACPKCKRKSHRYKDLWYPEQPNATVKCPTDKCGEWSTMKEWLDANLLATPSGTGEAAAPADELQKVSETARIATKRVAELEHALERIMDVLDGSTREERGFSFYSWQRVFQEAKEYVSTVAAQASTIAGLREALAGLRDEMVDAIDGDRKFDVTISTWIRKVESLLAEAQ